MKRIIMLVVIFGLFNYSSAQGGIFDRIKEAATDAVEEEVNEEIDKRIRDIPSQRSKKKPEAADENTPVTNAQQERKPITSVDDLYGHWQGIVAPGQGGLMERVTVNLLITPEFASMRSSGASTRCVAELTPTGALGIYDANILNQQARWGSKARVEFADGGEVFIDWIDAPDTPADKRIYSGKLRKVRRPRPRNDWSSSPGQREDFDIVGFTLGMKFEDAVAYCKAEHEDLESSMNYVRDEGTVSIIYTLTEKDARKVGGTVLGEQVTVGFESLTNEEMQVEQDPETVAKIQEREQIIEQRNKMQQEQPNRRQGGRVRRQSRNSSSSTELSNLPEVPPMPRLRPDGADAEAVFISRSINFVSDRQPYKDKIITALIKKYGEPSLRIEPQVNRIKLAWIYDAGGNYISNAAGGPCDQITDPPSAQSEIEKHYAPALRALQTGKVFNLVTMAPSCGLVVKAELSTNTSGAVRQINTTVYDTQRLLGDNWYRVTTFERAQINEQKEKTENLKSQDIPDF